MTTLNELKDVLKETLEARGTLDQIKARIRAEIFAALDDQDSKKPELSSTNLVINELIRDYLEFNNYHHTLSVFLPETGQPSTKLGSDFLASELHVVQDPELSRIPLLYSLVANSQRQRESAIPTDGNMSNPAAGLDSKHNIKDVEACQLDFSQRLNYAGKAT
mmetsp:Transcript_24922/g.48762  ORF Transcript_24922/g.48762 Transcript_24922/m.48762 type:complete len:163 (-) Transcript_24922:359-847(-)